jgi:FAD/FMN-containing dehydrogenase
MIEGMVNNSSGTTSIRYGVTRDKIVEIKAILSDTVVVCELTSAELKKQKVISESIYKSLYAELSNEATKKEIVKEFPKPEIHRRNTGYAVDILLHSDLLAEANQR